MKKIKQRFAFGSQHLKSINDRTLSSSSHENRRIGARTLAEGFHGTQNAPVTLDGLTSRHEKDGPACRTSLSPFEKPKPATDGM